MQWNFSPEVGVNAPAAWDRLNALGRPGGLGVKVAVLDTGVAYASRRGFKRSPDLLNRFVKGHDFVDDDAYPDDLNGHGTHVASTIAETVGNGFGVTGLAYGTRIMPVRVLDRAGTGDSVAISGGIRYAARKGAKIINLSFEFDSSVTRGQIPDILDALRFARRKGVLVVGASGNFSARAVAYPARASQVLAVGATTEHLCQADYSNSGSGLDIAGPGGGLDADVPGDPNCRPGAEPAGRDIYQVTYTSRSVRSFGLPGGYVGTSMAAPHVSATAALVIASGVIGPKPTPAQLEARLKATARDLGTPGPGRRATAPASSTRRARSPRSSTQVVRMISTLQGAWCETLFGTEPSRKRFVPVMPLLPTTIRSACVSSATSRIASAASPSRANVSTFTPVSSTSSAASFSVASTSSRGLTIHSRSFGTSRFSSRRRWLETGSYADTTLSEAPTCRARSVAACTALPAVSDPSVPTTIDVNMVRDHNHA